VELATAVVFAFCLQDSGLQSQSQIYDMNHCKLTQEKKKNNQHSPKAFYEGLLHEPAELGEQNNPHPELHHHLHSAWPLQNSWC